VQLRELVPSVRNTGRQVRVYEEGRRPREWNLLLAPGECAVFFRRVDSQGALSPDGEPMAHRDATFLIFDSLEAARTLCEAKVLEHPEICCEIFDRAGRVKAPLLEITHPDMARRDDSGVNVSRQRKWIAIVLLLASPLPFWWDWRTGGWLGFPTLIGIVMIFTAIRFFHWNFSAKGHLAERQARIEEHLRLEKQGGGASESSGGLPAEHTESPDGSQRQGGRE
jgi:hypothetical protein